MKDLIDAYLQAKEAEESATAARRAIGARIADELEHPEDGSKTHTVGEFKVVVKGGVNRRVVDWALFDSVDSSNPSPCKTKRELDVKGLSWYRDNEPDTYAKYCQAIVSKPAPATITIKKKEK